MDKEVGKYLIDVSKLVFGGVVLAGIWKLEDIEHIELLLYGIIASFFLAVSGFLFVGNAIKMEQKRNKKNRKKERN
jgi:hypothetical protein